MASNPNVSVVEGMDINPEEAECAGWIEVASKKKKLAERADCNAGNAPTSATGSGKGGSRTAASQNVLRRVVKASRIPNLPRDHFKTIIRPRGGMDVKKTDLLIFKRSLAKAASLTAEQVFDDTLCTNPFQNIFVVATPFEANARAYARVQEISMGSTVIGLAAYVAASDNTCKGVIRGINVDLSDAELTEMIVNRRNPDALGVRRIKKTPTVIVLFDGQKVPQHVVCDGVRYPCSLYRSAHAVPHIPRPGSVSYDALNLRQLPDLDELFDGYDKRAWPTYGTGEPTKVVVDMHINTLGPMNAEDMDYEMDIFFRQAWRDPRISLRRFGHMDNLTVNGGALLARMWKPDLYFVNAEEVRTHSVTMPNQLLRLSPDGDVLISIRLSLRLSCLMYFYYFPFDKQRCFAKLRPYINTLSQVVFIWREDHPVHLDRPFHMQDFNLIDMSYENYTIELEKGSFSCLQVTFLLERQQGFHMIQTYLPIYILVFRFLAFSVDQAGLYSLPGL
nr:glycine receptor subunit alpha-2-like [Rhipicephalus microplus]